MQTSQSKSNILLSETDNGLFSLSGTLDKNSVPELWGNRNEITRSSQNQLSIDLSKITHCDSAGIALLIQLQNELNLIDKTILISNPTHQILQLIKLSHLEDILQTN